MAGSHAALMAVTDCIYAWPVTTISRKTKENEREQKRTKGDERETKENKGSRKKEK